MKRTSLLVALIVVLGMVAVPAVGAVEQQTESGTADAEVTPGERLSGVIGVQGAEIDGEVERNAFAIALERADDNATKAGHIAEKLSQTDQRLAALDERNAELREQRERGEITEGQYRARTATLATEVNTVERQLEQSNATAAGLPAETLEENGVNVTAIHTLMNDASELSGGEVSEIARSIAGDRSGMPDRAGGEGAGDRGDRDRADADRSGDRGGDRSGGDGTDAEDEDVDSEQDGDDSRASDSDDVSGDTDDSDSRSGTDRGSDADSDGSTNNTGGGNADNAGDR